MSAKARATLEDLARAPGKAELVNGEVVLISPTGDLPASAGGRVYISLTMHAEATGAGRALPDNAAFQVDLPHRQTFSPDASFYTGPRAGMEFFPVPPVFAAEVRSKGDYGPRAEREMAQKRADYFAAGDAGRLGRGPSRRGGGTQVRPRLPHHPRRRLPPRRNR